MADKYDPPAPINTKPNQTVVPALINTPVAFIAPHEKTTSSGEIWIAVSCTDENYGGCIVYCSNEDTNYKRIGVMNGQCTMGMMTSSFTISDTSFTIDLAESFGTLENATNEAQTVKDSLCYLGTGEFIAYNDITPGSGYTYTLENPVTRELYGSTAESGLHAFVLLDNAIFKWRFNKNVLVENGGSGQLYFKFVAFNQYRKGLQDLADCTAYGFAVTESGGIKALLSDIIPYTAGTNIVIDGHVISSTASGGSEILMYGGFNEDIAYIDGINLVPNFLTDSNGDLYYY